MSRFQHEATSKKIEHEENNVKRIYHEKNITQKMFNVKKVQHEKKMQHGIYAG